jgi:hypothetical protein
MVEGAKIKLVVSLEVDPRNFKSHHPSTDLRNKADVDFVGIAPTMSVHTELRQIRAAALPLQLQQPLLEMPSRRYTQNAKRRSG